MPVSPDAQLLVDQARGPLKEVQDNSKDLAGTSLPVQPAWTCESPGQMVSGGPQALLDLNDRCMSHQSGPIEDLVGKGRQASSLLMWFHRRATWNGLAYDLSATRMVDTPSGHAAILQAINTVGFTTLIFLNVLIHTVFPPDLIAGGRPAGGMNDEPACYTMVQLAG